MIDESYEYAWLLHSGKKLVLGSAKKIILTRLQSSFVSVTDSHRINLCNSKAWRELNYDWRSEIHKIRFGRATSALF